jgi:hypothetical protein
MIQKIFNKYYISLLIVIFLCFFKYNFLKKNFLEWDEINYLNAAKYGFVNNALDKNSLEFKDFLKISLLKKEKKNNEIQDFSKNLLNEDEDLFNLRHIHHILPIYYWSFFTEKENTPKKDIKFIRISQLIISLTIAFLLLFKSNRKFIFLSTLIISFFLTSKIYISSFSQINYHFFFALSLATTYFASENFYIKKNKTSFIILAFAFAILTVTIETAYIIFSVLTASYLIKNYKQKKILTHVFLFLLLTLFFIFIIWPGSVLKLSLIKTALMHAYRIFFQNINDYSNITYIGNLYLFIKENFFLFLLIVFINYKFIIQYNKKNFIDNTFWLCSIIYFLIMLKFMVTNTYLFPAIFLNIFITIKYIEINFKIKNYFINTCLILILILNINFFSKKELINLKLNFNQKYDEIKNIIFNIKKGNDKKIIADGAHMINYYNFKVDFKIDNLSYDNFNQLNLMIRNNYVYKKINEYEILKNYNIIIVQNRDNTDKIISRFKKNIVKIKKYKNYTVITK